jgi:hypothetical protein
MGIVVQPSPYLRAATMSPAVDESKSAAKRFASATMGVSLLAVPCRAPPPLVEGINVPNNPLHENLVLVEGDQLAEHMRRHFII